MRSIISLFLASTVCICAATPAQTIHTYSPPAGSLGVVVNGGSQDGTAVTGWYGWMGGPQGAFRWTLSGGVGVIPAVIGFPNNVGTGISRDGVFVGGSSGSIGFRWSQSGGSTAIGPYPSGSPTEVYGISPDGVTCFGRTRQPSGAMRAFTWTQSGGLSLLAPLAGGFNSYARASNPNATVIIGSADLSGADQPVIWSGGTIQNIGALNPGNEYLTSMSDNALTLWGYAFNSGHQALRYRNVSGTWVRDQMGNYPGATSTIPTSTSVDGTVTTGECWGGTAPASGAFIWSTDLGWREMNTWLTSVGFNLGGLQILNASGISADGTALFGRGNLGGQQVGWVARGVPCHHAPSITQHPTNYLEACVGGSASFTVAAGGNYTGNIQYQWYQNNLPISNGLSVNGSTFSGATSPSLTITNCSQADTAQYFCLITNPCGSTVTGGSQLYVWGNVQFFNSPAQAWSCNGGSASFVANAFNATYYQWEWFNGTTWSLIGNGPMFDINTSVSWTAVNATTANLQLNSINFGTMTTIPIRIGVGNPCRALRPIETALYLDGPMDIDSANSQYYCHSTAANFTIPVPSGNPTQYNWQLLDPTFNVWIYLNDGLFIDGFTGLTATVAGVGTTNLSFDISVLGTVPNQLYFRCAVANSCAWYFSGAGVLTICRGDFNCDGSVDFFDYLDFVDAYSGNLAGSDFNGDGNVDFFDYLDFVDAYSAAC